MDTKRMVGGRKYNDDMYDDMIGGKLSREQIEDAKVFTKEFVYNWFKAHMNTTRSAGLILGDLRTAITNMMRDDLHTNPDGNLSIRYGDPGQLGAGIVFAPEDRREMETFLKEYAPKVVEEFGLDPGTTGLVGSLHRLRTHILQKLGTDAMPPPYEPLPPIAGRKRNKRMYGGIGTAGVLTGGIGTAGVLTGGIGTAGVLTGGIGTGGARDFVSRMDGGAKRMMMELKDKPDKELKQLYHDLGKGMFQSIKRVLADEMEISMSVKPRKSTPKKVKAVSEMEAKPKHTFTRKPMEKPAEAVEEQKDIVKEQMLQPVPKIIRRRIVRKNPQGSILKSVNPDGSITAKGDVNFPGQSVPTRAEIIQATSGTGGGMIGGARPKRQASAKMKARGNAVRRLMKEKGMSLGEASKYLKAHPDEI